MIPFGAETVTLLKRVETVENGRTHVSHEAHILTGCSWRRTVAWPQIDTEMRRTETVVCRIPPGQAAPSPGDFLFLGVIEANGEPAALLDAYRESGAIRISSVSDYTRKGMPMPHYAAKGM